MIALTLVMGKSCRLLETLILLSLSLHSLSRHYVHVSEHSDYIGFLHVYFPICLYDIMLPQVLSDPVGKFVKAYFCLGYFKVCSRSDFLDLNVLSQKLQGIDTPSK